MSVFISYRRNDLNIALSIHSRLKVAGIDTYIDLLDSESQSTDDITSVITKNISSSTHLIAVLSSQTTFSWWVPFEIGEATILGRRIASYNTGLSNPPEYLSKWPQMNSMSHIDYFIDEYKNDRGNSLLESATVSRESRSSGDTFAKSFSVIQANADRFHNSLKHKISRGY
ncbi:toll/interleukin-1 receptor domain-containing protein [Citrobacter sp. FDAARGOS_156]|uniref:toll/interleukin-1 receptor domain-containing protein n=1 Tax=Citrobacter sp. FDAARGOS_156 TaxID=1702170 RepID=UPI001900471D|nr:toll/interleukin-1 receptor domain-containing protein [Citrobacter sp. FDAARGOS_156]MBJ9111152.1 toll/interleukin-1 receptor domain-containing protein [Citrobacter sp. FDAARGOS_156]